MKFKGTIIITDPCYITKNEDYERTNCGNDLDMLGFSTFLVADTGFGDWSNYITKDTGEELGQFCADSGQVCVVLKQELDNYNPDFFLDYASHTYVKVEDFEGDIEIDRSCDWWTVIRGEGNINFTSDIPEDDTDEEEWDEDEE